MNLPRFDDRDYTQCSICGKKDYSYTSKKCLHKLCEKCYNNKFGVIGESIQCHVCSQYLYREDYSKEAPLQIHFEEDMKRRRNINQLIYKRKENFPSNEEYNTYLEFVEKCIQAKNEKEIEKKYSQNKKEKEDNFERRQKELDEIKKKVRENSPMHYNSSKFCLIVDDGILRDPYEMEEQNPINMEPVRVVEEKINYIPDLDKRKMTGGYDTKKIKEFFSIFSKAGFINKTTTKT